MLDNHRPLCYNKNIEREVIKMKKNLQKKSMTKKQWKEEQKKNRLFIPMNTGTRTMKTAKNPSRQERKNEVKKKCLTT